MGVEDFGAVYPPEVFVGDMLWVDRTLTATTAAGVVKSGVQTLTLRVAAVWYGRDGIDVVAQDALGVLAGMRPRRGKLLPAGDRLRMADVEAICHWAGLKVRGTAALPDAVQPAKGFVWAANESGLGGLRRYLADQAVVIRSDAPSSEQDHVHVLVLVLPTVAGYTYVSSNGRKEGFGRHELTDWALGHDGRQVRLFVGLGLAARNAPSSGEGWALGVARRVANERPLPLVAVDRSYASDDGTLGKRVSAEAARLASGLSLGWIEATANLGVELYDVVRIDETDAARHPHCRDVGAGAAGAAAGSGRGQQLRGVEWVGQDSASTRRQRGARRGESPVHTPLVRLPGADQQQTKKPRGSVEV